VPRGTEVGATRTNGWPGQTNGYAQPGSDHASSRTEPDDVERLTGIYGSVSVVPGGQEVADSRSDGNTAAHPADSAYADTPPQAGRRARLGARHRGRQLQPRGAERGPDRGWALNELAARLSTLPGGQLGGAAPA
jgi:hypothetical protein